MDTEYKNIKVFRFNYMVLKTAGSLMYGLEFRSNGPIPIMSGDKLLGFAELREDNTHFAELKCAIDPACPERLDIELEEKQYWIDSVLEIRANATVAYISTLILTSTEIPGQMPVIGAL